MRLLPALLVLPLAACGRLGFDSRAASGDDQPPRDGDLPADTAHPDAAAACTPAESTIPSVFGRTMFATPSGWAMPAGPTLYTLARDGVTLTAHDSAIVFGGGNNKQIAAPDGDLVATFVPSEGALVWEHLDGTLDHVGPTVTGVTAKDTAVAIGATAGGFGVLASRVLDGPMDYAETDGAGAQTYAFGTTSFPAAIPVGVALGPTGAVALWTQTPAGAAANDLAATFLDVNPATVTLPGAGEDTADDLASDGLTVLAITDAGVFHVEGTDARRVDLGTLTGTPTSIAATGDGFDVALLEAGSSPATVTLAHLAPDLTVTDARQAISVPFVSQFGFNPPSLAGGAGRSLLAFQFSADDAAQVTRLIQSCH